MYSAGAAVPAAEARVASVRVRRSVRGNLHDLILRLSGRSGCSPFSLMRKLWMGVAPLDIRDVLGVQVCAAAC